MTLQPAQQSPHPCLKELHIITPTVWAQWRPWLLAACWLFALGIFVQRGWHAYEEFDTHKQPDPLKHRPGNNSGHAQIDFGGQWVMGRMLVTGHGRQLYHRSAQWKVVGESFPTDREPPIVSQNRFPAFKKDPKYHSEVIWHDREWMLYWFMGKDTPKWNTLGESVGVVAQADPFFVNPLGTIALATVAPSVLTPDVQDDLNQPAIGGPLYPPVHAVLYSPLGLLESPELAYRIFQISLLIFALISAWAVSVLSSGRIWAPISLTMILLYPGFRPGLDLGQNAALSLMLLLVGMALAVRNRPILGGIVWGCLAFKPVFAVMFLLVPLLLRQWRFSFAMMGTGAAWIAVTLPFVGLQPWFDWLTVGKEATQLYNVNETWNMLSRDLHGLIRRVMLDYSKPDIERNTTTIALVCWGFWGFVFIGTIGLTLFKRPRQWVSPITGFALIGMMLCSFRFMYYDILLTATGMLILLASELRDWPYWVFVARDTTRRITLYLASVPMTFLLLLLFHENWFISFGAEVTVKFPHWASVSTARDGSTALQIPTLQAIANVYYPIDTLLVLGLWIVLAATLPFRPQSANSMTEPGEISAADNPIPVVQLPLQEKS